MSKRIKRRRPEGRRPLPTRGPTSQPVISAPMALGRVSLPLIDYIDMVATALVKDSPVTLDTPVEGVFMAILRGGEHGQFSVRPGLASGEDRKDVAIVIIGRLLEVLLEEGVTQEQLNARLVCEVVDAAARRRS